MCQYNDLVKYMFNEAKKTKHKVFLSFYHGDDEYYKEQFEKSFGHLFIIKSVQEGDIDSDNSDEYIKRLIQEDYISDSSVLMVLVGPNTRGRKHVDWEISAALNKKVGGYSGLMGILLPEFPLTREGKYFYEDLPPRLSDNVKSGYSKTYLWSDACSSNERVKEIVEEAFNARTDKSGLIDNSRTQKQRNS